ncbi:septum formation family protein [Nocardiopsis sp. NPDC058631]|uniref:DUF4190 domain-containing protein n=1 Tax=Nocardiopsis sp. NPDC058631 TaxID=3346566 RepID=UPI00364A0A93
MDVETLAFQVSAYVRSAVGAFGQAVLSRPEDTAANSSVRHGQRMLAALLRRGKSTPEIEDAVRRLAGAPEDPLAAEELRDRIRQALREDPDLARDLAAMNVQAYRTTVSGHHNVTVGNNQQGPIHMGDNTHHNVHHTVHNNLHEQKISGFSIAALVLGLLGFLILPIPIAIVFGLLALHQVLRSPSSAQAPGLDQAGREATTSAGPPTAAAPQAGTAGPAGSADTGSTAAANSTARPAESTRPAESGADPATAVPEGSVGQAGPSAPAPPPGADQAAPIAPDGPVWQWGPTADMYPPPAYESAAPSTPFTPPFTETSASFTPSAGTGFAVPAAPTAGTGFAAAKALSVVFSLLGLLAAGLWGLGWTAAAAIVAQAEPSSHSSGSTDPSFSTGAGEAPEPAELCEPSPGYATVCTLETGDCFVDPPTSVFYEVELTSCDEPHNAQVIGSYSPSSNDWPGDAAFYADIDDTCSPMSERALDPARTPDTYFVGYIAPTQDAWDYGIQEAFCYVAADGESWTTSLTS